MNNKPFSQACENNKAPILAVLSRVFSDRKLVLEIGTGTGQHAIYFAPHLSHLKWQPSDRGANLPGIQQWISEFPASNLLPPTELDVTQTLWPIGFDAVFSANTAHIMSWAMVRQTFSKLGEILPLNSIYALYGPFNYNGRFTSPSNRAFDKMLREHHPDQGIRDFEAMNRLAQTAGMKLLEDNEMPANNRLLVWQKTTQ